MDYFYIIFCNVPTINLLLMKCSDTSRPQNPDERDGKHFHFVSRQEMERDIENNIFVQHNYHDGHYFGTSVDSIRNVMNSGLTCLLDLDPQVNLKKLTIRPMVPTSEGDLDLACYSGNKDGSYPRTEAIHSLHSTTISQHHEARLDTPWNHKGENIRSNKITIYI